MKVVLSRKEFDSEYGGYPSPILPDGRMISLPIPFQSTKPIAYSQLKLENDKTYFDLMRQLNDKIHVKNEGEKGKWIELTTDTQCHLDPDIYKNVMKRPKDWKSLFGQIDAAQSHLKNNEVDAGDIFLFFGIFRKMKFSQDGKLGYDSTDKRKHIVSGYLQIGEILEIGSETETPGWMNYHPHTDTPYRKIRNNIVYIAKHTLSWNNNLSGAGVFDFNDCLVLTKEGCSLSQ